MLSKLPHYLTISRHGIYYLRVVRNGRECRRSLHTRDPREARAAAYAFGATIGGMTESFDDLYNMALAIAQKQSIERRARELLSEKFIEEEARKLAGLDPVPVAPATAQPVAVAPLNAAPHPITLSAAVAAWIAARRDGVTQKTIDVWSTFTRRLILEFGGETLIHTLSPGQITDAIGKLKKNRSERTVLEYAHGWHLMFDWLLAHEHVNRNPVVIPKKATRTAAARQGKVEECREPWTASDLNKIFNPERLDSLHRPEFLWLPWLALYTGARREALINLHLSDFHEYVPGKWSVRFHKKFDKTAGDRVIPIHPQLITAGLLDYINDVRSLGFESDELFPHVPVAKRGRREVAPGNWTAS